MKYPPEVWEVVRQAVERCKTTQGAVAAGVKAIKLHPKYQHFVDRLVEGAVTDLVGYVRQRENQKLRAGKLPTEPYKVNVGTSRSIQEIADRFAYRIGGTTLGSLTLDGITTALAARESQIETAAFEKHLLQGLKPLVPKGKRVQDAVSRKQLDSLWRAAERMKEKVKKAV